MSFKDDFFKGEPLCKTGDCEMWGVHLITPEIADEILDSNAHNRKLNKKRAEKYAEKMKLGRWNNCGPNNSLSFDKDGNLSDGQHRTTAIKISGIPRQMFIFRNCEAKAGTLDLMFDVGLKRTTSNITGFKPKYEEPMKYLIRTFVEGHGQDVSADEVVAFDKSLKCDEQYVLSRLTGLYRTGFDAPIRAAFFFWFVVNGNKELTVTFTEKVLGCVGLNKGEAAIHEYITKDDRTTGRGENGNRENEFYHVFSLLTEKRDTKSFREETVRQIKGWLVGRY